MRTTRTLALGLSLSLVIVGVRWAVRLTPGYRDRTADVAVVPADTGARPVESRSPGEPRTPLPEPLEPGQPVPETTLIDHDGRELRLSDLRGRVVVLAFIYTHCNTTSMCPLATGKLVEVQRLLAEREVPEVQFLLVTFDPRRDQPDRLKSYGASYGPDFSTFTLATGKRAELARLSRAFNTYYRESSPGVFEHNIVVSVIGPDGVLRDDFFGTGWDVTELVQVIEELALQNARRPQWENS